jgi:hypothetical protein
MVEKLVKKLAKLTTSAKDELSNAQQRQKQYADRHRRDAQFEVGEQVLLSTKYIKGRYGRKKLDKRFIGPFKILERIGEVSYRLDLKQLNDKLKIHDVIHISNLRKFYRTDKQHEHIHIDIDLASDIDEFKEYTKTEAPNIIDNNMNIAKECILDCRAINQNNQYQIQYLIKYKHKNIQESEWKSVNKLKRITHLVQAFIEGKRQTLYSYQPEGN